MPLFDYACRFHMDEVEALPLSAAQDAGHSSSSELGSVRFSCDRDVCDQLLAMLQAGDASLSSANLGHVFLAAFASLLYRYDPSVTQLSVSTAGFTYAPGGSELSDGTSVGPEFFIDSIATISSGSPPEPQRNSLALSLAQFYFKQGKAPEDRASGRADSHGPIAMADGEIVSFRDLVRQALEGFKLGNRTGLTAPLAESGIGSPGSWNSAAVACILAEDGSEAGSSEQEDTSDEPWSPLSVLGAELTQAPAMIDGGGPAQSSLAGPVKVPRKVPLDGCLGGPSLILVVPGEAAQEDGCSDPLVLSLLYKKVEFGASFVNQMCAHYWNLLQSLAGCLESPRSCGRAFEDTSDGSDQSAKAELAASSSASNSTAASDSGSDQQGNGDFESDPWDSPLHSVPFLSRAEQRRLEQELSGRGIEKAVPPEAPDYDESLVDMVERQVRSNPHALAVVDDSMSLSYGELRRRARRLAWHLLSRKELQNERLSPGTPPAVGLGMERGAEWVVALIAVLYTGMAYVPLDPLFPDNRIQKIVESAELRTVITTAQTHGRFEFLCETVRTGSEKLPVKILRFSDVLQEPPHCGAEAEEPQEEESVEMVAALRKVRPIGSDPCYILFTSGSTGEPKGVIVLHQGVRNMCHSFRGVLIGDPPDVRAQLAAMTFDLHAMEIFLAFDSGAAVAVCTKEELLTGLGGFIRRRGVRGVVMTPTVCSLLEPSEAPCLQWLAFGGEVLPRALVRKWTSAGATVVDHYGPTEVSIAATGQTWRPGDTVANHIGRPLPGAHLYVLGPHQELMPVGVPGEICIAGVHVSQGYLKRPDLTSGAYLPNPFSRGPHDGVIYRTGDRGRWMPNGNLQFLGRIDFQIKLRGLRVEPGEIESHISRVDGVARCVVVLREDDPGRPFLAAYMMPTPPGCSLDGANRGLAEDSSAMNGVPRGLPRHHTAAAVNGTANGDYPVENGHHDAAAVKGTPNGDHPMANGHHWAMQGGERGRSESERGGCWDVHEGERGGSESESRHRWDLRETERGGHESAVSLVRRVRRVLEANVPDYMVPSAFVVLERLPQNHNGKVDRKQLPKPKPSNFVVDDCVVEAGASTEASREASWASASESDARDLSRKGSGSGTESTVQTRLCCLFAQVLGLEASFVRPHSNFFHLGGNSLAAARLRVMIRKEFKLDEAALPIAEFFQAPTVDAVAEIVHGCSEHASSSAMPLSYGEASAGKGSPGSAQKDRSLQKAQECTAVRPDRRQQALVHEFVMHREHQKALVAQTTNSRQKTLQQDQSYAGLIAGLAAPLLRLPYGGPSGASDRLPPGSAGRDKGPNGTLNGHGDSAGNGITRDGKKGGGVGPAVGSRYLPLSHAQEMIWLVMHVLTNPEVLDISDVWRVKGKLDVSRLERSLAMLVHRQQALRLSFSNDSSVPARLMSLMLERWGPKGGIDGPASVSGAAARKAPAAARGGGGAARKGTNRSAGPVPGVGKGAGSVGSMWGPLASSLTTLLGPAFVKNMHTIFKCVHQYDQDPNEVPLSVDVVDLRSLQAADSQFQAWNLKLALEHARRAFDIKLTSSSSSGPGASGNQASPPAKQHSRQDSGGVGDAWDGRVMGQGGLLFRLSLLQTGDDEAILVCAFNHLIMDGISAAAFYRELKHVYEAGTTEGLPPVSSYAEYVAWEDAYLLAGAKEAELKYWKERIGKDPPPMNFGVPAAKRVGTALPWRGAWVDFVIPAEQRRALEKLAWGQNATLNMALLAAFHAMLHAWSGRMRVVVGMLVGRRPLDLHQNMMGHVADLSPVLTVLEPKAGAHEPEHKPSALSTLGAEMGSRGSSGAGSTATSVAINGNHSTASGTPLQDVGPQDGPQVSPAGLSSAESGPTLPEMGLAQQHQQHQHQEQLQQKGESAAGESSFPSFPELLEQVRRRVVEIMQNQTVTFRMICTEVLTQPDLVKDALVQAYFNCLEPGVNCSPESFSLGEDCQLEFDSEHSWAREGKAALTPLNMTLRLRSDGRVMGRLVYQADVIDAHAAEAMVANYRMIIDRAVEVSEQWGAQ